MLMSASSSRSASKRRINRWLRREQRDHRTTGLASRQEPGLSFTQDVRMGPMGNVGSGWPDGLVIRGIQVGSALASR